MIIKNFYEYEYKKEISHGGKGLTKSAALFASEEFSTNLQFIIYTEIEPGASIGYHKHGEDEEVYIILEGNGVMNINGEAIQVKPGDVVLNKPSWSHGLENNSDKVLKILVFEVKK